MERTLIWEPGGLGSGATLVLTRCDLREVTLPLFSDLENQEAGHGDGWDPFRSLRLELSGPDSIQKRVMGETCHRRALLPPRVPWPRHYIPLQFCALRVKFRKGRGRHFTALRKNSILGPK